MPGLTMTSFHKRKPGGPSLVLLVLILSLALIWVGCLVWIDNSIAIIPDNDPATFVSPQAIKGFGSVDGRHHTIQSDVRDFNSGSAQRVVRGNGDQDDNREEYFSLIPLTGTLGQSGLWSVTANYNQSRQTFSAAPVSKVRTEPKPQPRPSGFVQRRTVVAYKDFGHLKVMSAEGGNSDIFTSVFISKEGHLCNMGGLLICWKLDAP